VYNNSSKPNILQYISGEDDCIDILSQLGTTFKYLPSFHTIIDRIGAAGDEAQQQIHIDPKGGF
jgi:hypothetical protein